MCVEIDRALLDRVNKFIRLLASDNDGEALAAARALRRVLSANKLDFNDLAELLDADIAESAYQDGFDTGFDKGTASASRARARSTCDSNEVGDWRALVDFCLDPRRRNDLSEKEETFLFTIRSYSVGGLSYRQWNWLESIHHRLQREGRHR